MDRKASKPDEERVPGVGGRRTPRQAQLPARPSPQGSSPRRVPTVRLVRIALMVALTTVCSQIALPVPFTPVPFTLQALAVLLSGMVLGPRDGALAQFLYLLLGAVGLPVYAQLGAGPGALFGLTGGYLWGFVPAAALTGWLSGSARPTLLRNGAAGAVGLLPIYAFGVVGLQLYGQRDFVAAVAGGVLPFVALDLIKAGLAGSVAWQVQRWQSLRYGPGWESTSPSGKP